MDSLYELGAFCGELQEEDVLIEGDFLPDRTCRALLLAAVALAMAGDRLDTDMAMARRAGALGVLVLSGEASAEEVARQAQQPPDLVVPTLSEFGALLREARGRGA